MSSRLVNDSASGSMEKETVLFYFGLAAEEPHLDEKLSALRVSLRGTAPSGVGSKPPGGRRRAAAAAAVCASVCAGCGTLTTCTARTTDDSAAGARPPCAARRRWRHQARRRCGRRAVAGLRSCERR